MWTPGDYWKIEEHYQSANDADHEVKSSVKVNTTAVDSNNIAVDPLERKSSWKKMRHVIAIMLKWKEILHSHERLKISHSNASHLELCLVQTEEVAVIILCQGRYIEKDINALHNVSKLYFAIFLKRHIKCQKLVRFVIQVNAVQII